MKTKKTKSFSEEVRSPVFLTFLNFPGLFVCLDLSSKEIKTNAAANSALFLYLPEKENRFRDFVIEFPINYTILASEIVLLGRARLVFPAAKFKKVKNTGDLFLK